MNWFTYYAEGTGGPTAIKQANLNHQVFQISEGIPNLDYKPAQDIETAIRAKYDFSLQYPRAVDEMRMLAAAAEKAKSIEPVKVAEALEGMKFEVMDGGEGFMRKDDHQFFQPIYISSFGERSEKEPFDEEKAGRGWNLVTRSTRLDRTSDDVQDGTAKLGWKLVWGGGQFWKGRHSHPDSAPFTPPRHLT